MTLERQPLYARAEAELRARIARGDWKPGEALPTEPVLAADLGISQGTLRRALAALERQRLIERRQGIGSHVAEATRERELFHFFRAESVEGLRLKPTSFTHGQETVRADAEETRALKLGRSARVHRLWRERRIQGRPMIAEMIVLPAALFPGFAVSLGTEVTDELYVLYQQRFGITIVRVEERIQAVKAPPAAAALLNCEEGWPLLLIHRIGFDVMDRPVERRCSWLETTHFRYAVELR
nr:GntR family transcriptional regulator [uncultured Roseococcus sp.]